MRRQEMRLWCRRFSVFIWPPLTVTVRLSPPSVDIVQCGLRENLLVIILSLVTYRDRARERYV